MSIYGNDPRTPADETVFGAFGEFEAMGQDIDWADHDAMVAEEMAAYDAAQAEEAAAYWEAEAEAMMAHYDDDPSPYAGDYSEM